MGRRASRFDMPPDLPKVIQALRTCRETMIGVQAKVRVTGPVYHAASMVMAAVDAMATLLTRDPEFFWAKGSVMTEQEQLGEAQRATIEKGEKP